MTKITDQNYEEIEKHTYKLGFPIMIKAAKRGGKGIRVVYNKNQLIESIQAAKRETLATFKDDSIYIEKSFENPRHIEVQILGDHYNNVIHLNIREYSIQRKHQKLIRIAQKAEYYNTGTVEFIPYNIVFGGKVPEDKTFNEHSIECRITAEDPEKNLTPASGKISVFEYPENVRIDTFIEEGIEITPFYDSLFCKVIAKGKNKPEATQKRRNTYQLYTNYFSNWQEKYKPIHNEKIVGSVFNKYRSLVLTKQGYETNRSETKIQDLSMWKV